MGIDGVLVTGAGDFGRPAPGVTGNRFVGTSVAAPHVAGIAALVMEAQRKADSSMTKKAVADAVAQKLRDTAIDLGEQDSDGYSKVFGYGRADAFAAIESIADSSDSLDRYSLTSYTDTYTVNSTGDGADSDTSDGVCDDGTVDGSTNCTLRAAIEQTNAGSGAAIKFNISGSGAQTISPASALPAISVPVLIDGYSQPGAGAGTVLIELAGTNTGDTVDGLTLQGSGSHVRGLAVNSFGRHGIRLEDSRRHVLVGNMIGTDTGGSADQGNGSTGVYTIRASDVLLRDNVISGNGRHGVETVMGGRIHLYANKVGPTPGAQPTSATPWRASPSRRARSCYGITSSPATTPTASTSTATTRRTRSSRTTGLGPTTPETPPWATPVPGSILTAVRRITLSPGTSSAATAPTALVCTTGTSGTTSSPKTT